MWRNFRVCRSHNNEGNFYRKLIFSFQVIKFKLKKKLNIRERESIFSRDSVDDDDELTELRTTTTTATTTAKTTKPSKSFKFKIKPSYLIDELKSSKDPNDLKQLTAEIEAYELFKQLEKLLAESDMLSFSSSIADSNVANPPNSNINSDNSEFILDTLVVKNILDLADTHMYIKYYKQFADTQKIDVLRTFAHMMMESFARDKVIRLRFYANLDELVHKLAWTFIRNERVKLADNMLNEYLNYIEFLENYVDKLHKENSSTTLANERTSHNHHHNRGTAESHSTASRSLFNDNSRFILLLSKLNTLSNLIIVKNTLCDFASSLALYKSAKELLGLAHQCILFL